MQYLRSFLLMAGSVLLFSSCTGGWNDENKQAYLDACADSPNASGLNQAQRKAYCTCSLDEAMKHYTTIEEVIDNKDSAVVNKGMLQCRTKALQ